MKSWEPIFDRISKLNDFDPKVSEFRRYFLNGATMIELDCAGRLLIPPESERICRHLKKTLYWSSAMNKIEIWDKSKYQQFFETFSPEDFSESGQRSDDMQLIRSMNYMMD